MKLQKLFLLLALPFFFAGCTEGMINGYETGVTKLTLNSEDSLQFTAEGGNGTIAYTLLNAVAGTNLEATCDAQWVKNITIGEEITFTVAANEGDARNTKIVVSYAQLSFEVGVAQAGKSGSDTPADPNDPTEKVTLAATYLDGKYYDLYYETIGYNYYIILSDKGFDENNYAQPNGKYYYLDIYGIEAVVDDYSYTTVPAGTYTYDANDTTEVGTIASASGYMVINSDATDCVIDEYFDNATLVVTSNGLTLKAVIGNVEHTVTYNGVPELPVYFTSGEGGSGEITDANFTALDAYAGYYGDEYTPGTADNFYLVLSDLGFDEYGYEYAGGTYYAFDIYAPITADMTITPGTYLIDNEDSCDVWTVSSFYSAYYKMDAYGSEEVVDYPYSGYITFNEDGTIYAVMNLEYSGATHTISYNGDIYIEDVREGSGGGDSGDGLTTLTGNYTCSFDSHTLYYTNYGDYYENDLDNYVLTLYSDDNYYGDIISLEIFTAGNDFTGNYTITDTMAANTAYVGCLEYGYYMAGSWYYTGDDEEYAALVDGEIEVLKNSNGTYTLTFVACDELGNDIDGTWTGLAEEYADPYASSTAKRLSKSLVVEQKATPKVTKKQSFKREVVAKGITLR